MLKAMKQRSQFPSCLNFAFQGRAQKEFLKINGVDVWLVFFPYLVIYHV